MERTVSIVASNRQPPAGHRLQCVLAVADAMEAGHIEEHLARLAQRGLSGRSQARHLAAIRMFHKFLCADRVTKKDPARVVERPKIGRKLPVYLTVDEVEALLCMPDVVKPKGARDNTLPRVELLEPAQAPASVDQSLDLTVRSWDEDGDGLWVQLFAREVGGAQELPLAPRFGQGLRRATADTGVLPSGRRYEIFAALAQAVTGFGFAMIAVPLPTLATDARTAVVVSIRSWRTSCRTPTRPCGVTALRWRV